MATGEREGDERGDRRRVALSQPQVVRRERLRRQGRAALAAPRNGRLPREEGEGRDARGPAGGESDRFRRGCHRAARGQDQGGHTGGDAARVGPRRRGRLFFQVVQNRGREKRGRLWRGRRRVHVAVAGYRRRGVQPAFDGPRLGGILGLHRGEEREQRAQI